MQRRFKEVLGNARCDISFFREEIEALTTQEALPPPYREAYRQMVEVLVRIEQIILEKEGLTFPENLLRPALSTPHSTHPRRAIRMAGHEKLLP